MKCQLVAVGAVLVMWLLSGCRPERMQAGPIHPRTVAFAQAGVSLVMGEEWLLAEPRSDHNPFPPRLVSPAGTIRVILLPPDRSDPAVIADVLRADFDRSPQAGRHSFRKEEFVSNAGVRGLCVSYLQLAETGGHAVYVENSHFLVRNGAGRCVAINYLASADSADSAAVQRLLRAGLSLQ